MVPGGLLPWAHRTRLQQLRPSLLTTNVSNKSGNLLFAQKQPEWNENVGFVHSSCTVEFHEFHQKPYRRTPGGTSLIVRTLRSDDYFRVANNPLRIPSFASHNAVLDNFRVVACGILPRIHGPR